MARPLRPFGLAALGAWALAGPVHAAEPPAELLEPLRHGQDVVVIVELDSRPIERDLARRRARHPRRLDDDTGLAERAARYAGLARSLHAALERPDLVPLRDYRHLPLTAQRVRSEAALHALAGQPGVIAVHADRLYQHTLAQSVPLTAAPQVHAAALQGQGSTVAVIDDGINLTHSAFGGCTAVGTPAACRIAAVESFVTTPSSSNAHGSNVSAIVLGMAPQARIASLGVFGTSGASTTSVLAAIDWAIEHRTSLDIVALNMSLGDGTHYTSACSSAASNPFVTPVANARNAGISVVAATGNNAYSSGSFVAGISRPACTPGVVSVGAVYDSAMGGLTWFSGQAAQCTDASTAADRVACFSSSAGFMRLLAPGAIVTAAGSSYGGTSQASPHVAGALAVLRAAYPAESLATAEDRLVSQGTPVTDARNGLTHPRLNLLAAYRLGAQADLSVALSGPSTASPGVPAAFTASVGNAGPQAAFDVVVDVALPGGWTATAWPAGCTLATASLLRCTTSALASGGTADYGLTLQMDGTQAAAAPLTASLGTGTSDPNGSNNQAQLAVAAEPGGEVPTLPPAALAALAGWLLWRLHTARGPGNRISGGPSSA